MSEWKETDFGPIPEDWKISTLGGICELITDGSHSSPKPLYSSFFMASVKDMRYNYFDFSNCKTISKYDFDDLNNGNCSPKKGDILISKDGANCLELIFVYKQPEKIVLLSSIAIARLKEGFDPDFYRFFLLSPNMQFLMRNNFVSGSAIPRVVLKDFRNVPVPLIPFHQQKAIAKILLNIDDKIDLLHRQNATLEKMAETLFRQWFVEEAKEDWEEGTLGKVIDVLIDNRGKTPPTVEYKTEYPLIEVNALNSNSCLISYSVIRKYVSKEIFDAWFRKHLKLNDIIISTVGTIGVFSIHLLDKGCIAQNLVGLRSKSISSYFIYNYLKVNKENVLNLDIGGVQPSIKVPHLLDLKMKLPSLGLIQDYHNIVEEYYKKITINSNQIQTLTALRDTLLPKLMSGEVRVEM